MYEWLSLRKNDLAHNYTIHKKGGRSKKGVKATSGHGTMVHSATSTSYRER